MWTSTAACCSARRQGRGSKGAGNDVTQDKITTLAGCPLHVASIGECMVEMAPAAEAGLFRMAYAGDTFNTAWYLKRLRPDWRVAYVSRVGGDSVSDGMVAMMQDAGIDTAHMGRVQDRSVGLYLVSLANGERSFSYWRDRSAAKLLAEDRVALAAATRADVVYVSGITLAILDPAGRDTLLAVLRDARDEGRLVAFDPNLRPRLWPDSATMTAAIMQAAEVSDIVLPSFDDESTHFADATPGATRDRYLAAGVGTVIVKNGPGEILYADRGAQGRLTPPPAPAVVDTTAAGDSFNAGFLAALLQCAPTPEAISAGAALAARVIGARGALVEAATMGQGA
jgi:2-dehydro-3-deoxygluconokinase